MIKISVVGPESSGKSTIALYLSRILKCSLNDEYSREYLQKKKNYTFNDLKKIGIEQNKRLEKKIKNAGNYIISDTCLLDLEIWSEVKFKKIDKELKSFSDNEEYDLYFLCKPDIPWEADPLRENPFNRPYLFKYFKKKLQEKKKNFYVLEGNVVDRLNSSLDIILNYRYFSKV